MKAAKGKTARLACGLAIIVGLVLPNVATEAATTQYQYDALGRLRQVVHDNGIVTSYTLDPAGNRTQVADTPPAPPSAPASISVGTSSVTGSVTVTWGAASGVVTAYELYESSSNSFPSQTLAYSGTSTVISFTRPNGTYWYRVRACRSASCSAYTTAGNAMVVSVPPPMLPAPTGLSYSLISNCVWQARWNAVTGASYYRFRDTAGNEKSVSGTSTTMTCPFNNQNGNKPKWVRACDSAGNCGITANF
jgi:YD repeat-containing protein